MKTIRDVVDRRHKGPAYWSLDKAAVVDQIRKLADAIENKEYLVQDYSVAESVRVDDWCMSQVTITLAPFREREVNPELAQLGGGEKFPADVARKDG